ncbi:fasciclin domain-containing protein [Kineosporia mesophila]|uniref:Fasciclin domain-containing protein n=1 Tax=Kineosporia mesophila TaxID=566012 RepID=A0ABP6Z997_9ACTN|nr:fasciclin domain-containing protein [Kineosporia mesophila]MCD5352019.1 fasciclin domain-containing protein [Kineosporia mesophila]
MMRLSRPVITLAAAAGTAVGLTSAVLLPATASASAVSTGQNATTSIAQAATSPAGNRSLASVLLADKHRFDHNGKDFDILRTAVVTVLKAKPKSSVSVLTDGKTPVTAFLPTDRAFELLVKDITKAKKLPSEKAAFRALAGLGTDTIEEVLLYHVVPGSTITGKAALKSDGAVLKTAQGGTVKLKVALKYPCVTFRLVDADKSDANPQVIKVDVNKGNKQIGHVINRVLRPVDLP